MNGPPLSPRSTERRQHSRHATRTSWRIIIALTTGYAASAMALTWANMALLRPLPFLVWERLGAEELLLLSGFLFVMRYILLHHLVRPLRQLADIDDLTGVLRAGAFWEAAEWYFRQARRQHTPFALVVFDIDNFKRVNDTYGHAQGDQVLAHVGMLLRHVSRDGDVLGRLGGEEFGWVLPGSTEKNAQVAAHRLLEICQTTAIAGLPGIGVSGGIALAMWPQGYPPTAWDLARRADQALYQAKAAGKGQFILARSS